MIAGMKRRLNCEYLHERMIWGWTVMEDRGEDWVRHRLIEKE
jgi:hypothetical protein